MGKKRHSDIWNYFKDNNDGTGICEVCQRIFSYRTSASNLRKHLLRKHPNIQMKNGTSEVELVNMENFDIIDDPVIDLKEKRNRELNKLIVKVLDSSCENDNENLYSNSKHSVKDTFATNGDPFSDEEYNPLNDSSGSSSFEESNSRRKKKQKVHENDSSREEENCRPKVAKLSSGKVRNVLPYTEKPKFIKSEIRKSHEHTRSYSTDSNIKQKEIALKKPLRACDAYAVNLSYQLYEMNDKQRFIAEKLISDIVFFGRFNKLSEDAQFMLPQKSPAEVIMVNEPDDKPGVQLKYSQNSNGIS